MRINDALAEYCDYCVHVRNFTPTTMLAKRCVLIRFVRWYGNNRISKLSHNTVNQYAAHLRTNDVTERSINTYLSQIISFIKYMQDMGYKTGVKTPLIVKPRVSGPAPKIFYTAQELNQVIDYADIQPALMIAIAFDTGMRRTALANLCLNNFNGRRVIYVDKGRKRRESYITIRTRQMLDTFVQNHRITNKLWGSYGDYGVGISTTTMDSLLRTAFNDYADKLELQGGDPDLIYRLRQFHIHSLRHSFATDLQSKGASIEEIKELMGHSNTTITEHYLHGFDGQLQQIFDKYKTNVVV